MLITALLGNDIRRAGEEQDTRRKTLRCRNRNIPGWRRLLPVSEVSVDCFQLSRPSFDTTECPDECFPIAVAETSFIVTEFSRRIPRFSCANRNFFPVHQVLQLFCPSGREKYGRLIALSLDLSCFCSTTDINARARARTLRLAVFSKSVIPQLFPRRRDINNLRVKSRRATSRI